MTSTIPPRIKTDIKPRARKGYRFSFIAKRMTPDNEPHEEPVLFGWRIPKEPPSTRVIFIDKDPS